MPQASPGPALANRVGAAAARINDHWPMSADHEPGAEDPPRQRADGTLGERVRRTDSKPGLVATAKRIRQLLPGDERYGDALSTAPGRAARSTRPAGARGPGGAAERDARAGTRRPTGLAGAL